MTEHSALAKAPIFFERNRVFRVYRGGKLFHEFFGDENADGNYPEEWLASCVQALNRDQSSPTEGLSVVKGTNVLFKELLEKENAAMLGGKSFNILVKILDSALRLPLQTHPDRAFSRAHFNSDFGKTEMWLILATRKDACIYFGFKNKISSEEFARAVERSKTQREVMTGLLNRIPVKSGDVFLIPARAVHAIGSGCMLLEVQEPTDFTIQPEYYCGDYPLSEYEMYLGLDKATALSCFDFGLYGPDSEKLVRKTPKNIQTHDGYTKEVLIDRADTPCFCANRYLVGGAMPLTCAPAVYVVTEGNGVLSGPDGYAKPLKKSDCFFMPAAARGFLLSGSLTLAECYEN